MKTLAPLLLLLAALFPGTVLAETVTTPLPALLGREEVLKMQDSSSSDDSEDDEDKQSPLEKFVRFALVSHAAGTNKIQDPLLTTVFDKVLALSFFFSCSFPSLFCVSSSSSSVHHECCIGSGRALSVLEDVFNRQQQRRWRRRQEARRRAAALRV